MIKFTIALVATLCVVQSLAGPLDVVPSNLEELKDSHVGYDKHQDSFYYVDDKVNELYARKKYQNVQETLAGQRDDASGHSVEPAVNPFAVGQRALRGSGVLSDRWDVKENQNGHQFFGLYHGEGSDFVVNKLRSHLLREVMNAVQNNLYALDNLEGENAHSDTVRQDIKDTISRKMQDVNAEIRETMRENDGSSADAVVVIVTKNYVIVANMGRNRVLGYDLHTQTNDLSGDFEGIHSVFGDRASQANPGAPLVKIIPRVTIDEDDDDEETNKNPISFLVVETGEVARLLNNEYVTKTVATNIIKLQDKPENEQDIYSKSVNQILTSAQPKAYKLIINKEKDRSVIVIGLNREYKNVH